MGIKIGHYRVSDADAKRLRELAKNIDGNSKELSAKEEKEIEKSLDSCNGDVSRAEAMLRRTIIGTYIIPEMVKIPAGKLNATSAAGDKAGQPGKKIPVASFKIGKYEVTNAQYEAFLVATVQALPKTTEDEKYSRYPAVNVTWHQAVKYCEWLSQTTGRKFRLPTEAEWEYAAGGKDGRRSPVSIEQERQLSPVDSHPEDNSVFGVRGMSGQVWEWLADDMLDPKGFQAGNYKILRGVYSGATNRVKMDLATSFSRYGFRVAEDLK
jgi:formylglycine-generating enzyme required for sulfatase activity